MRILISNDDGYPRPRFASPGRRLSGRGRIDVIAPEQNASGTSKLADAEPPAQRLPRGHGHGFRCLNGTPSDCVHLALTGLLGYRPDLVLGHQQTAPTWATTPLLGHGRGGDRGLSVRYPGHRLLSGGQGWGDLDAAAARVPWWSR